MLDHAEALHLHQREVLLIGCESVGKSGLFRELTGEKSAIARNIKGSTISALNAPCKLNSQIQLTDLPGLQFDMDSQSTQLTLDHLQEEKTLLLVIKATNLKEELIQLQTKLNLKGKKVAIAATHGDKYLPPQTEQKRVQELLQVPIVWVNTRAMDEEAQEQVMTCIEQANVWGATNSILDFLPSTDHAVNQLIPIFRLPIAGPLLACLFILSMFALPVFAAYLLVSWLEPIVEQYLLTPITLWIDQAPLFVAKVLIGDYGLITLGSYSFLWAFPVVMLISITTTITEESGIQEHITHALDPWLRKIGLTGRDLLPVITGFGCNVVAVFQSRSCSSCTRASCISLISFGSACSYQIGATLSIFSAAHVPLLFIPYLLLLFVAGAIHTRIWNRDTANQLTRIAPLPYIQKINWQACWWKVVGAIKQFVLQAMPIFLLICLVASVLHTIGILSIVSWLAMPLLYLFSLPVEAAPGLIFSFIRKDGLLVLNEGQGSLLMDMSVGQIFILVYLATTLSACLVTLFTIGRELGWKSSLSVGGKQMLTSIVSAAFLAVGLYFLS
ncbi:nucleoside recognition domain-containing protein [Gracilibacillus alcaliphilus]|uniref:nucleoside recognition domain-containing protein n=1 Tax=Gracilibacillus alcaliphilus TaxID=1401441 RepID=UPI0019562DC2|nr:nucleoside recognition domain-containing protein [Gracilibacillus alcaliphilus]MBM7678787.1 Fe2+ transport system protein B [Gracilibacillus alcaliphilus]